MPRAKQWHAVTIEKVVYDFTVGVSRGPLQGCSKGGTVRLAYASEASADGSDLVKR